MKRSVQNAATSPAAPPSTASRHDSVKAFARKFNLGRDAVGRRLGRGGLDVELDTEIVGLVADTRRYSHVKSPKPPLLYVPYRQEERVGTLAFYARSSLPPDGMLRTLPALVAGVDPNLPVTHLTTLPRQVEESVFEDRSITVLAAAFAGLATLLAAVGLYGVLAYTVAQRTREFGLRMALGADAARLRAMVLGQVGRMTLVGGAVGLVAAIGVGRLAPVAALRDGWSDARGARRSGAGNGRRGAGRRVRPGVSSVPRQPDDRAPASVAVPPSVDMFSRLRSFLTAWTRRERFEDSLDEEVRFHLDAYAEDLVRSGMPRRGSRAARPDPLPQRRGHEGRLPAGTRPAAGR